MVRGEDGDGEKEGGGKRRKGGPGSMGWGISITGALTAYPHEPLRLRTYEHPIKSFHSTISYSMQTSWETSIVATLRSPIIYRGSGSQRSIPRTRIYGGGRYGGAGSVTSALPNSNNCSGSSFFPPYLHHLTLFKYCLSRHSQNP